MILMTLGHLWIVGHAHGVADAGNTMAPLSDIDYLLMLASYAVCSLIAGVAAALVFKEHSLLLPVLAGTLLTLAGLYNCMHMKHPGWFMFANLVTYLPFTLAGYFLARKKGKMAND
jgi:hypothetical protein